MKALMSVIRELWSLFVDDGSLALSLIIWSAIAGTAFPHLLPDGNWSSPIFFIGCVVILLLNVVGAVRRHSTT